MPVIVICSEHPEADVLYVGDVILHAAADHPGEPLATVFAKCHTTSMTHEAALGRKPAPRRFRCIYCAAEVVTDDPDRPPYCNEHLDRAG